MAIILLFGCTKPNDGPQLPAAKQPAVEVSEMPKARLTYEDSCRLLQKLDFLPAGNLPPLPAAMPAIDDATRGVSFFRTLVADAQLDNLTIPRTYVCKSEIRATSFKNTDLSESRLCWNDFIAVDFTETRLAGSDLRASIYERVKFVRADLQNADLRRATFKDCDFTGCNLRGAKLSKKATVLESLTPEQRGGIDYQPEGNDPPGG